MPPCTCRLITNTAIPQGTDENKNPMQNTMHTIGDSAYNGPAADVGTQAQATKKVRVTGPVRARPLRLELVEEEEDHGSASLSKTSNSIKGKAARPLERKTFLGGFWGAPESLTPPDLPRDDSVGGDTSLSTVGTDLLESLRHSLVLNMEVLGSQIGTVTPMALGKCNLLPTLWHADTNFVLKLMLQCPLIRLIIQDAIENVRALILFTDAFPDATLSMTFTKDALISAAKAHLPASYDIHARLMGDDDYVTKIRGRICLFHGDVKEECTKAIETLFKGMVNNPARISQVIEHQLQQYHYIFPGSLNTLSPGGPGMCGKPYQNGTIISAISNLYFNGPTISAKLQTLFSLFLLL
ncbi:hypothetical protein BJV77DRAFT_960342 [Russula vinacea]|nr:hypothetical protein BJV77DRAFT_960342 [Russula vinacea]